MTKIIKSLLLFLSGVMASVAYPDRVIRFHCPDDTLEINQLLTKYDTKESISNLITDFASEFIGRPYVAHTLECTPEALTINIHEFDCVTFVETSIALALTAKKHNPTWRDFANNLESIRYRKGILAGYASRLHYISDWIVDNTYSGNLSEITRNFDGYVTLTKTINYMSKNADKYKALADSTNLAEIKKVEMGYRSHLIPYLKKQAFAKKLICQQLQDGDIIVILSKESGLDTSHVALVKFLNDRPHLLHASTLHSKVILEEIDIYEYLKRYARSSPGVRVLRISQ